MIHASKYKILVSGSLAYDQIMNFPGYFKENILPDKIHVLNVSFHIDKLNVNFGGTAGNIAYNLALLKEEPIILSTVGKDFGDYKKWLNNFNIDTSKIKVLNNELTAAAYIITDQADNQITGFYAGAMTKASRISVRTMKDKYEELLAIIAPGNPKNMVYYGNEYRQLNIPYIFDPGQQIPMFSKKELISLISGCQVFISNDYELSLVLKKTGLSRKSILKKVKYLITTLGEKGSEIITLKKMVKIPIAKPKNTSDPTGAGDAYRAGIIKGIINNYSLEEMGRLASLVSVYTVEKYGTQTHRFTLKSLEKRYNKNFKEKLLKL